MGFRVNNIAKKSFGLGLRAIGLFTPDHYDGT